MYPTNVYVKKINLFLQLNCSKCIWKRIQTRIKDNKQMYTLKFLIYNTTGLNVSEVLS